MEREQSEVRFPLGNNLYLTAVMFKNQPLVHIRYFRKMPSAITPGKTLMIPTQRGICLNEIQLSQMIMNLPSIVSAVKAMSPKKEPLVDAETSTPITRNFSWDGEVLPGRCVDGTSWRPPTPEPKKRKMASRDPRLTRAYSDPLTPLVDSKSQEYYKRHENDNSMEHELCTFEEEVEH